MKFSARYPTDLPAWVALKAHYRNEMRGKSLAQLFAYDKARAERLRVESGDLLFDYSKNFINTKTVQLLLKLAREAKVSEVRDAMFAGEAINTTENRSVLHVALRAKMSDQVALLTPGVSEVWQVLDQMEQFVNGVHEGKIVGYSERKFTDVVNIGIGGSDLGVVMATRALHHHRKAGINVHCVSNVDGTQLADLTKILNPATTLFVVCSKTFTTLETMTNAREARRWLVAKRGEEAVASHFAAASTNHKAMDEFGINRDYRFAFWDWVGGRFSLWSAAGISIALAIGMDNYRQLLAGARNMDFHFRTAAPEENMPMLLALLAIWYNNFFDGESMAILPYDNRLDRFPAFLQQLQMESNGKSVRKDGKPVKVKTGQLIWGEAGNNAQHSFYQLLHQGTRFIPADFILTVKSSGASQTQQDLSIANCLAQSEALMDGYSLDKVIADLVGQGMDKKLAAKLAPHKVHAGNSPSNMLVLKELTPFTLGQLTALYEHKVFVKGVIYGINSFDQNGVELGKRLAGPIASAILGSTTDDASDGSTNSSTGALLDLIRTWR